MAAIVPKEYSFNPRGLFCRSCGKIDERHVVLVGDRHVYECAHCHTFTLDVPDGGCKKCGCRDIVDAGHPAEDVKFPLPQPCDECRRKIGIAHAAMLLGGFGFYCRDCGSIGAWQPGHAIIPEMRKRFSGKNYGEIDKSSCPFCQDKSRNTPPGTGGTILDDSKDLP